MCGFHGLHTGGLHGLQNVASMASMLWPPWPPCSRLHHHNKMKAELSRLIPLRPVENVELFNVPNLQLKFE